MEINGTIPWKDITSIEEKKNIKKKIWFEKLHCCLYKLIQLTFYFIVDAWNKMVDGVNLSPFYIIPLANYHNYQTIRFVYILFFIGVIETVPLLSSPSQLTGPKPPCARKCTKKGPPVCGSNGRTYRNKCRFLVAQCRAKKRGKKLTFKPGRCTGYFKCYLLRFEQLIPFI